MYNMSLGDMGDKFGHMFAYGLYGIICVVAALFVWKLVPETKGKTLEDLCGGCSVCLEACSRNERQDTGRHDQAVEE